MCAVLVNKAILSSWSFNFPLTMIASQMVISFLLLWALKRCEFIHYDDWSLVTAQKVCRRLFRVMFYFYVNHV